MRQRNLRRADSSAKLRVAILTTASGKHLTIRWVRSANDQIFRGRVLRQICWNGQLRAQQSPLNTSQIHKLFTNLPRKHLSSPLRWWRFVYRQCVCTFRLILRAATFVNCESPDFATSLHLIPSHCSSKRSSAAAAVRDSSPACSAHVWIKHSQKRAFQCNQAQQMLKP